MASKPDTTARILTTIRVVGILVIFATAFGGGEPIAAAPLEGGECELEGHHMMDDCFDYNLCVSFHQGNPCGELIGGEECSEAGTIICTQWAQGSEPPQCQQNGTKQCSFDGGGGLPD